MTRRPPAPLTAAQQALVEKYRHIPAEEARRFVGKWPEIAPELPAIATDGFVAAARTFNATKGPSFEPYARWRVRCAIRTRASRTVFRRYPALAAVVEVDQTELDGSLHDSSGAGADAIERALDDTPEGAKQRVLAWAGSDGSRKVTAMLLRAELQVRAYPRGGEDEIIARQEYTHGIAALAKGLAELTDESRRIVVLHYGEDRSLRAIARDDGVDPKRIQNIHDAALTQLGRALRKQGAAGALPLEGRPSGFEGGAGGVLAAGTSEKPKVHVS